MGIDGSIILAVRIVATSISVSHRAFSMVYLTDSLIPNRIKKLAIIGSAP